MKNRILYWVICLLVFTSCSDFLEDYSQLDRKKNIVINSGKRETYFPVVTCNG